MAGDFKNYVIGSGNIIKGKIKSKDGNLIDLIELHIFDPLTGNRIKVSGLISEEESKFKHEVRDKETNKVLKSFPQHYFFLQFQGLMPDGETRYDYNLVPVKTIEQKKKKATTKAETKTVVKQDDDDLFGI